MNASRNLSPLGHPVWLTAVVILVLNDHVFKQSPALAGLLTGKLSDVAGLVVAPPLLAVLVGASSRWARLGCMAAVGAVFAAINVSPPCARALEAVLSGLGMPSRVVVDPTDLLTLPSLWLAYRVLQHEAPLARWALRPLAVLGLLACVATSPLHDTRPAQLVNHRNAELSAVARYAPLDCDFSDAEAQGLTQADFGAPYPLRLGAESFRDLAPRECGAVWLTVGTDFNRVVAWRRLRTSSSDQTITRNLLRRAVTAEGTRHVLRFTVGAKLLSLPPPLPGPPTLPTQADAGSD